ncbi:MAG: APC family permease [Alphaproteobacteria bacterium]|nr:APC family permease [Alphaproteobacteria bacterium]MCB9698572.1 APC family permease [Alphaproteobacteria bacterium]
MTATPPPERHGLGLASGIGLVAANMIGAGVLLSTGFLAQHMDPGVILSAWVAGAGLALCGALAYSEIAANDGRSGGEYAYLARSWHPVIGSMAGMASLVFGFAAPLAVDAYAVGEFARTLGSPVAPRLLAGMALVALAVAHAIHPRVSASTQNLLVAVKGGLLALFVTVGLFAGNTSWPTWTAPDHTDGFPWGPFLESQYWIAFAFSGWNAAIYAAAEFRRPRRDVPRALLIGCGMVAVLYLAVNWVFVANLDPAELAAVMSYEDQRVTLAHVLLAKLAGPAMGKAVSVAAVLALVSAMSAMTMLGPHVGAVMARDGWLPRWLAPRRGKLPLAFVLVQTVLALGLLYGQSLLALVERSGAVLLLFSWLTVVGLLADGVRGRARLRPVPTVASVLYVTGAGAVLAYSVLADPLGLAWLAVLSVFAGLTWWRREPSPVAAAVPAHESHPTPPAP